MKKALFTLAVVLFGITSLLEAQENCVFDNYFYFYNSGSDQRCPGEEVNFYSYCSGEDVTFLWDFGNEGTRTGKYVYDITFTDLSWNVYSLTITNECGADTTVYDSIEIRNDIDFDENSYIYHRLEPERACPGENIYMDVYGDNMAEVYIKYTDTDSVFKDYHHQEYNTEGIYPIVYNVTNYCGFDTIIRDTLNIDGNIKFSDANNINVSINPAEACPGDEIDFYVGGTFETATWKLGDGKTIIDNSFDYEYESTGLKNIEITLVNTCGFDTVINSTIEIKDDIRFYENTRINIYPDEVCPNDDIRFSVSEEAISYDWDISDGTTSDNDRFTGQFSTSGTYNISLTIVNGCGIDTTVSEQFLVRDDISYSSDADLDISRNEICPLETVSFDCDDNASSYIWTFGDGEAASGSDVNHTFTGDQDKYPISLMIQNGCGNTATAYDTVFINNNLPLGDIRYETIPVEACPGQEIFFYTDPEDVSEVNWFFDGGVQSDEFLAVHSFDNPGNYGVGLQVVNGCGKDSTFFLNVSIKEDMIPSLDEYMYEVLIDEACIDDTVSFSFLPITEKFNISWDFGDGTSSSTPDTGQINFMGISYNVISFQHSYSALGTYNTVITLTNECGNSVTDTIPIVISDDATLPPYLGFELMSGQLQVNSPIQFMAQGGLNTTIDYGDGTTEKVPSSFTFLSHTYESPGTYTVTISASNNCGNSVSSSDEIKITDPETLIHHIEANICEGSSHNYDGTDYSDEGIYDFIYDVDSIVILDITVHPHYYDLPVDTHFCSSESVVLNGTTYSIPGFVVQDVPYTSVYGCDSIIDYTLKYDTSAFKEEICIVTIDLETEKNLVTWTKTPNQRTTGYKLYRETDFTNVYDSIAYLPYDSLSVVVDLGSKPKNKQELYKLVTVDACGNEISLNNASYHKTLLLKYVSSVGGVNLEWDPYEIDGQPQIFDSYIIYRGSDSAALAPLTTVSGSLTSYIDTEPEALTGKKYYRIAGVKTDECDPNSGLKSNSGPFSRSLSNLEDNRQQASNIENIENVTNLSIFPNPFSGNTNIQYSLSGNSTVSISVYDMVGRKAGVLLSNEQQMQGIYQVQLNASDFNLNQGIYFIHFEADEQRVVKKIIYFN